MTINFYLSSYKDGMNWPIKVCTNDSAVVNMCFIHTETNMVQENLNSVFNLH